MREEHRERKDWSVILLLLFFGILLMLVAGQRAIQLLSHWSVSADMGSNLNPNLPYQRVAGGVQPLDPAILTPAPWNDTYLTPGSGTNVVPMVVFDPSTTPEVTVTTSPTPAPPTATQVTSTATSEPTSTATDEPPPTKTKKPKPTKTSTPPTNPPPTNPPPTNPPVTSTVDPSSQLPATPSGFNQGLPDGSWAEGGNFPDGSYFVVDVSSNPVVVNATPDGHYDMVYYEVENPVGDQQIAMDQVIVGISKDPSGNPYYQVLNWGDGQPDTNTNIDTTKLVPPSVPPPTGPVPSSEDDNQIIPTNVLYEDPSSSPPPSNSQTGVLIDVDTAPSHPPADTYNYVVVIAPPSPADGGPPNNVGDGGQVDSIQVTEVASPTPP